MSLSRNLHCYRAFGLCIQSELALPELIEADGPADVLITLGSVPEQLAEPIKAGVLFQVSESAILVSMEAVGRFLVSGGNAVVIEPANEADAADIRTFLLGSVIGALLHQRGLLPIHGSAVAAGKGCAVFTGPSGVGKSTLTAALAARGRRILSDDISAVQLHEKQSLLLPAFPRLKLWADALQQLQHVPETYFKLRRRIDKYAFPIEHQFQTTALPLHTLIVLGTHASADLRVSALRGVDALKAIKDNVYRLNFVAGPQATRRLFDLSTRLAKQVRVLSLTRPTRPFLLSELADRVDAELGQ